MTTRTALVALSALVALASICQARALNPSLGRWLSRDPIGYRDGVAVIPSQLAPQSCACRHSTVIPSGLYAYCSCTPIAKSDPTGLIGEWTWCLIAHPECFLRANERLQGRLNDCDDLYRLLEGNCAPEIDYELCQQRAQQKLDECRANKLLQWIVEVGRCCADPASIRPVPPISLEPDPWLIPDDL